MQVAQFDERLSHPKRSTFEFRNLSSILAIVRLTFIFWDLYGCAGINSFPRNLVLAFSKFEQILRAGIAVLL